MNLQKKVKKFVLLLRRRPAQAWDLLQIRAESILGVSLHYLSLRRMLTYRFERRNTEALDEAFSAYSNYFLRSDLLPPHPIVFSAGVGQDASFDLELIDRHDARIFLFDPTPSSRRYINELKLPATAEFNPLAVTNTDGEVQLFIHGIQSSFDEANSLSISNRGIQNLGLTVPCRRIKTLMDERGVERLDVLKLDIEGAAIKVLRDALESGVYPVQIAAEFERPESRKEFRAFLRELKELFSTLRELGYRIYRTRDRTKGFQVEVTAIREATNRTRGIDCESADGLAE